MKTYSSRQLAFHISVILSVLAGFLMLAAYYSNAGLWLMLSLILVFAVSAYFIMHFFLKIYISDKIKPVYKTILDLPASGKKQDNYRDTNGNILSELKTDVETWANIQTQEIERLKDLERYRKEFVGNVSHELKTPIFNIQGYILTLLEGGIDNPKILSAQNRKQHQPDDFDH